MCSAASEMGITAVAIYSDDDEKSLHRFKADEAVPLGAAGVPAYLDIDGVIEAAKIASCDAIHPGYGFLAENPDVSSRTVLFLLFIHYSFFGNVVIVRFKV